MSGIFDQVLSYNPTILASSIAGSVTYKGTWDAATNSPTLANPPASTTKGWYYVVSVAGTRFGIEFAVGDWIISNGSVWQKVDLTDSVSSVFGRTGAVAAQTGDYTASQISGLGSLATQNGTFSGTSSGTNTGDQSISITGDATAAASAGVLTATVTKINGTTLAGLATGILKNTTTTGVPSIAVAADFPTLNQNTTGTASNVTGTVAVINGGTGSTTASGARTNLGLGTLATQNGTFSGTSSGTNTGDQTISITGDVTASGSTGALTATVGKINGVALIGLGTGILKNSTVTGQPGIAVAADFPTLNQNTSGTASNVTGVVVVGNGGTGSTTLTGYVKGTGTAALTASSTIPNTDVSGLGTMSTQNASSVAITGGSINNTPIGASTPNTGAFTTLTASTPIGTASGGTGVNTTPSNGQVLIGNGTGYTANTLTAGSGITITNASGSITVAAAGGVTGVSSVSGTANEVTATTVSGAVTLSLPSALTFTGKTITGGTLDVENIYSTTLSGGFTSVAAAGTVTTLVAASVRDWTVTGSGGQTYQLPDATTLRNGAMFQFNNNQSSGTIVVRNNSATTVVTIQSGGYVEVILLSNATAAGSWDVHNQAPSNVTWSTNTFDYAGSFTGGTWNGNIVQSNRGGTGNGFTKFSGPTTAERTFTLPDSNATLLYSGGALGTPASGTLSSCTGLPISTGVSGLGTGVATFLATPSSANLASAVTDETGSGSLVFATSPTLVTPNLGTPSAVVLTNASGTASININGTVGATTPSTGAFTFLTATASGAAIPLSVTNNTSNYGRIRITNSGSTAGNYRGYEIFNGSTFKGGLLQDESTDAISLFVTGGVAQVFNADKSITMANGLAVTGALSTTGASQAACSLTMLYSAIQAGTIGITSNGAMAFGLDGSTGTTERMRISTSGNVGIGVTPSAWTVFKALDINTVGSLFASTGTTQLAGNAYYDGSYRYKTTNFATAYVQDSSAGTHAWLRAASGTAGNAISFTQAMTLDASGSLGLGDTSPSSNGKISSIIPSVGSYTGQTAAWYGSNGTGSMRLWIANLAYAGVGANEPWLHSYQNINIGSDANIAIKFVSGGERARIDSSGNLLVGTTSALNSSAGLSVQGAQTGGGAGIITGYNSSSSGADNSPVLVLVKGMTTTSSSARFVQFYADSFTTPMGGIVGNGSGNVQFASISDAREKKNIQSVIGSLDKILALKPVSFDWISNSEHTPAGFIAQDVKEVFPEFVVENMSNDGSEQRYGLTGGLNNGVTAHLVKALQELNANLVAQVAALSQRVAALESK